MELRVLRYFLTVAREGSFTRAANFLHVTQPTLSRQLMDLEYEVGQKLLVRGKHPVALTPEGMLLRKRAEEILSLVNKTEAEFGAIGEEVTGDVYIGGGETRAMKLIAQIIKELQTEHPAVRFHLFSGNADDVTERLDKGLLDFGILIQPVDISKYDSIHLPVKDVWGLVMRKNSPLAKKKAVKRKHLTDLPLIISRQLARNNPENSDYSKWFGGKTENLNIVATYNLIYNGALMVEEGTGYAVALDNLINTQEHGSLCFRPFEPRLESGLDIVWKKSQVFSKAAEVFLEKVQKKFSA